MSVRPVKTQISLGICPVWSDRLIWVFAVHMKKPWVLSYPLSAQRRLWSNWADAQADLSLRWAHTHFVGFVMSRVYHLVKTKKQDIVTRDFIPCHHLKIKIWFVDVHRVMKLVDGIKIPWSVKHFLLNFSDDHWIHHPMNVKKSNFNSYV